MAQLEEGGNSTVANSFDGEGQANKPLSKLHKWIIDNKFKISKDTIIKLKNEGFASPHDLECDWEDVSDEFIKLGINTADRIKLKKVISKLNGFDNSNSQMINRSASTIFDSEEITIIQSINEKITILEQELDVTQSKQKNVDSHKTTLEKQINDGFYDIIKTIKQRQNELLKQLNGIISKKKNVLENHENIISKKLDAIKALQNKNNDIINEQINLTDLPKRKLKILANEKEINQIYDQNTEQTKGLSDADNLVKFVLGLVIDNVLLNKVGLIVELSNLEITKLERKMDKLWVHWSCDDESVNIKKVKIGTRLVKDEKEEKTADGKDNNNNELLLWTYKDFYLQNSKQNSGSNRVTIKTPGKYEVCMSYLDNKHYVWSPESAIKSIEIEEIKADIEINTKIMKEREKINLIAMLREQLKCHDFKLKLLYRGSKDGYTADGYHTKCDGKKDTVTIVKSEFNNVFGGYTPIRLESHTFGKWYPDKTMKTFVFLLRSKRFENQKWKLIDKSYAIYQKWSYLPTFGGNDNSTFCIEDYMSAHSNAKGKDFDGLKDNTLLAGKHEWKTRDIEVFHLTKM